VGATAPQSAPKRSRAPRSTPRRAKGTSRDLPLGGMRAHRDARRQTVRARGSRMQSAAPVRRLELLALLARGTLNHAPDVATLPEPRGQARRYSTPRASSSSRSRGRISRIAPSSRANRPPASRAALEINQRAAARPAPSDSAVRVGPRRDRPRQDPSGARPKIGLSPLSASVRAAMPARREPGAGSRSRFGGDAALPPPKGRAPPCDLPPHEGVCGMQRPSGGTSRAPAGSTPVPEPPRAIRSAQFPRGTL